MTTKRQVRFVLITAGGTGERMKSDIPKQFIEIAGKPILMHTFEAFYSFDNQMRFVLVLPENQIEVWERLCLKHEFKIPHETVKGGETRFQSVKNGLSQIPKNGITAIHDGVRPLVSIETIRNCFEVAEKYGNAVPVTDIVETVRKIEGDNNLIVNREEYKLVATPQVFKTELIKTVYAQDYSPEFTDSSSVAENMGVKIYLTKGNRENIKITTPVDLIFAEAILQGKAVHK